MYCTCKRSNREIKSQDVHCQNFQLVLQHVVEHSVIGKTIHVCGSGWRLAYSPHSSCRSKKWPFLVLYPAIFFRFLHQRCSLSLKLLIPYLTSLSHMYCFMVRRFLLGIKQVALRGYSCCIVLRLGLSF